MQTLKNNTALILLISISITLLALNAEAKTSKELYFEAEAAYSKLRKSPTKQKYRSHWMYCVQKYQAVYRNDPSGIWASAGLYMTGKVYYELYKRSRKASDKKEAIDNYERIIKRFPRSKYRERAAIEIADIKSIDRKKNGNSNATDNKKTAKDKYYQAEASYHLLLKTPAKRKYRHNWLACIRKFMAAYRHDPNGEWAPVSLYMTGKLYQELSRYSNKASDINEAIENYNDVIEKYPNSDYRNKAELAISSITDKGKKKVAKKKDVKPKNPAADRKKKKTNETGGAKKANTSNQKTAVGKNSKVTVTGLRFWSNPNYTRIVIDVDGETTFTHNLLKRDPSLEKPQRLYVDLDNAKLGENFKKIIPIDDDLLSYARAGQFTKNSVRVVADIKSLNNYNVFSMKTLDHPFRVVMDLRGKGNTREKTAPVKKPDPKNITKIDTKKQSKDIAKQLALGVKRIVIDPGHGGKDKGAPGYFKGVYEKDIVLQIGLKLAKKIKKELKCEVIMTRSTDRYLTLEERTAIANTKEADLFISIHTNANRKKSIYGIETYFLSTAKTARTKRVAARENATSTKNISDLETILHDLMQNTKKVESSHLASYIQDSMCSNLKRVGYSNVKNKGVPSAPFYVLIGAEMPAVLVETSFISNKRECTRLRRAKYQERLCEGIVMGIKRYIKDNKPTAYRDKTQSDDRDG